MRSSHLQALVNQFSAVEPVTMDLPLVLASLATLPDPRARHGVRSQLAQLALIMLCSVLTAAKTFVEMAE